MPPLTIATFRFVIGGVCLLIYSAVSIQYEKLAWKDFTDRFNVEDLKILTLLGVINLVIPVSTISYGQDLVNTFTASIFSAATPVILQIVRIIAQEPSDVPYNALYTGIGVSILGLIVTFAQDIKNDTGSVQDTAVGCVLLLVSSASYAVAAFVARRNCKHIHPVVAATVQVNIGAVISLVLFLPWDAVFPPDGTAGGLRFLGTASILSWSGVIYQGLLSAFVGFLIYFYLIPRIGSARITAAWMTFPIYGVIESALFLNSWAGKDFRYRFLQCFGSLLVILGLAIILGGLTMVKDGFMYSIDKIAACFGYKFRGEKEEEAKEPELSDTYYTDNPIGNRGSKFRQESNDVL